MLVYVICYGAGMLFASSAHYYLSELLFFLPLSGFMEETAEGAEIFWI